MTGQHLQIHSSNNSTTWHVESLKHAVVHSFVRPTHMPVFGWHMNRNIRIHIPWIFAVSITLFCIFHDLEFSTHAEHRLIPAVRLFCKRFIFIFLRSSTQMPGQCLKLVHYQFLPHTYHSLFTIRPVIWSYVLWNTVSIVKWDSCA
jgi:dolichol kinase